MEKKRFKFKLRYIIYTLVATLIAIFSAIFINVNSKEKEVKADPITYTEISQYLTLTPMYYPATVAGVNADDLKGLEDNQMYYTVTGISGNFYSAGDNHYALTIPSYVQINDNQIPVKAIATGAEMDAAVNTKDSTWYQDNVNYIEKVVVPDSVDFIQFGSFAAFRELTDLEIPFVGVKRGRYNGATQSFYDCFLSIFGDNGFNPMSTYNFGVALSENSNDSISTAPYYLTSGGSGRVLVRFSTNTTQSKIFNCPSKLKKLKVTDDACIAPDAFLNEVVLEDVEINFGTSSRVKEGYTGWGSLGNYAFSNCVNIKSLDLPDEVTSLGDGMCVSCFELQEIEVPSTSPYVPNDCFAFCYHLKKAILPSSISEIRAHAFDRCYELDTIYSAQQTDREVEGTYALPISLERIGIAAFRQNEAVSNIIVGSNVQEIQQYAFNGCNNLTSITLPFIGRYRGNTRSFEALFGYVFGMYDLNGSEDLIKNSSGCTTQDYLGKEGNSNTKKEYYIPPSLKNVTITSESRVCTGAFMNCNNIQSLQIDSTISAGTKDTYLTIEEEALHGCYRLKDLNIPFVGPNDVDNNTQYYIGWIFGRNSYDNSLAIYNTSGTAYYIPYSLETITLNHQTCLPGNSFYKVKNVLNFNIGKATTYAYRNVFAYNSDMQRLSIPFLGKQRGIHNDHYYWGSWQYNRLDNALIYLFTYANDGDYSYYVDSFSSLEWCPGYFGAYLPSSLYKVEVTDETEIDERAFANDRHITQIVISDTTGYIAPGAFRNCTNLEYLEVPFIGRDNNSSNINSQYYYTLGYFFQDSTDGGFKSIVFFKGQTYKFYVPYSLHRIKIGNTFRKLSSYAFFECTMLTAISSTANISSLGDYCFYNCTSLTTFTFPNATYTYLPHYSFTNTKKIGDLDNYSGEGVSITSVGDYALCNTNISTTYNSTKFSLNGFTYIGQGAFESCQQITEVDFTGSNLSRLGSYAFNNCTHLTKVTLTQYLSPYLFASCTALENLDLNYVMNHLKLVESTNYVGSKPIIPDGLCYNCQALKSPYKVDNEYYGLQLNTASSGVVTIGKYAFYNCLRLTVFNIPTSVTYIKEGAFQKCSGLSYMLIPETCTKIDPGTDSKYGVYYGCNKDFYLRVYPDNSDLWPSGWGTNWNCYFPVYPINDSSSDMFTFDYDYNLRGYIISGFNIYQSTINENGWDFIQTPISGTIILPKKYNGLDVVGVKEDAFSKVEDRYIIENITKFVVPESYVYFGENAFNLVKTDGVTVINLEIFIDKESTIARSNTIVENDNSVRRKNYHYNSESYYADNAVIYYSEAWELVNNVPKYKAEGLVLELDQETYTYDYGKQIRPNVIGVTINKNYIKTTSNIFEEGFQLFTYKYLYQEIAGTYNYIVNSFNYVYSNNINYGRGCIDFTSNNSNIVGNGKLYFDILKHEVDIYYESAKDNNYYASYDTLATAVNMAYADSSDPANAFVLKTTYNANQIRFGSTNPNELQLGLDYYYLDEHYKISYVFATESADVGYYGYSDGEPFYFWQSGADTKGFVWIQSPKVLDPDGNDVTNNFSFVISCFIEIEQLVVDGTNVKLQWDYDNLEEYPEYKYRSDIIVPNAVIKDNINNLTIRARFDYLTYSSVLPNNPIDTYLPNSGGTYYIVKISDYDTNNISIPEILLSQDYKIVNATLTISMNASYIIQETDLCFQFSDWSNYQDLAYSAYHININALNAGSYIIGTVQTANYLKGLYKSQGYDPGFSMFFSGNNPLKIYSSVLKDGTDPLDETNYYNITLDLRCTISYQDIDYKFQIASGDLLESYHDLNSNDPGYVSDSYDRVLDKYELTYEADGYNHELRFYGTNVIVQPDQVWTLTSDNTTYNDYYSFRDINSYVLKVEVTKEKFNPKTVSVVIVVNKGTYKFNNIIKEFDRESVNVFNFLRRKPADFDPLNFDVKFYKSIPGQPVDAIDVGEYICIINTKVSSAWFEDVVDKRVRVSITQRSLYITVEDSIIPKNSKTYDGKVTSVTFENSTLSTLNLLPGDKLTGTFSTKSAQIGTYYANVTGDFVSNSTWTVSNDTYGPQRQNYKIVYVGDYTIEPREMNVVITSYDGVYDYGYHSIDVNVIMPNDGTHTVYYSLYGLSNYDPLDLEATFTFNNYTDDPNDDYERPIWSTTKPRFVQPGTYPIYVCVVANTYRTFVGSGTVVITGNNITYTVDYNPTFIHDGFAHKHEVTNVNPSTGVVYYKYIGYDPVNSELKFDKNDGWTTDCPEFTDAGVYYVAFVIECPYFRTTEIDSYRLVIEDVPTAAIDVTITPFVGEYDTFMHGFTITTPIINDLSIYYSPDDGVTWLQFAGYEINGNDYTLNIFNDIGEYPIKFKIRQPNHTMIETTEIVKITRIDIGEVSGVGVNVEFDNEYHTLTITGPNIYPSATPGEYYYQSGSVIIPLTLRYSSVNTFNNSESDAWQNNALKYKNVGSYYIEIEISAPGIFTKFVSGMVNITMPSTPPTITIEHTLVKDYDTTPFTAAEILDCVTTIHDGDPTFYYYDSTYTNIAEAPTDPGTYYVKINFSTSRNCLAAMSNYIEIVINKRVIGITYLAEVEFEKAIIDYHIYSDTQTSDSFELIWSLNPLSDYSDFMNIGTYWLNVELPSAYDPYYILPNSNPNYQLIEVKIVKRTVHVVGTYRQTYSTNVYWEKNSDWDIQNEIPGDYLTGYLKTTDYEAGKYYNRAIYEFYSGDGWYSHLAGHSQSYSNYFSLEIITDDFSTYLNMYDSSSNVVDYYYIKLDLEVFIDYPPIELTVTGGTYVYDGTDKTVTITTAYPTGPLYPTYWFSGQTIAQGITILALRDVGTYEIYYSIYADGYSPATNEGGAPIIITITQAHPNIQITSANEKTYDKEEYVLTYDCAPLVNIEASEAPLIYYYEMDKLAELGYDLDDLKDFYMNHMSPSHRLYNIWNTNVSVTRTRISTAGNFYVFIYFPGTTNVSETWSCQQVIIHKRALYFTYLNGIIDETKNYDSYPFIIYLNDFEYDDSPLSINNTDPDCGLLPGDYIQLNNSSLFGYSFQTVSADCRGESCDPYQNNGDFSFYWISRDRPSIYIRNSGNQFEVDNYYPAFNMANSDPVVKIRILRINLDCFYVPTSVSYTYDGEPQEIPVDKINHRQVYTSSNNYIGNFNEATINAIKTTSDGDILTRMFISDVDFTFNGTQTEVSEIVHVGYYIVLVSQGIGTNYKAWDGANYIEYGGVKYKKCKLTVTPYHANIIWSQTSATYNAEAQDVSAHILDVFENPVELELTYFDANSNQITSADLINSGSYLIVASFGMISIGVEFGDYILDNNDLTFTINPRRYTVTINERRLYVYQVQTYEITETYFASQTPTWIANHSLLMTISTGYQPMPGSFDNINHFVITWTVTDTSTTPNQVIETESSLNHNYVFNFNLHVELIEDTLYIYKDPVIGGEFTDTYYRPILTSNFNLRDINIEYAWVKMVEDSVGYVYPNSFDVNSLDYRSDVPEFKNVGYYRVFFKATLQNKSDADAVTGYQDIEIRQKESFLEILEITREYNGNKVILVEDSNVSGKYNRGTDLGLQFVYYKKEGEVWNVVDEARDIGSYKVRITSLGDNNPNVPQNYTPIEKEIEFEITRRTLTLTIDLDWVLKNEAAMEHDGGNGQFNGEFTENSVRILNSGNKTVNTYYATSGNADYSNYYAHLIGSIKTTGLISGDRLYVNIYHPGGFLPQIYQYYVSGISHEYIEGYSSPDNTKYGQAMLGGDSGFKFNWQIDYDTGGYVGPDPEIGYTHIKNYNLVIDFKYHIHYPEIEPQIISPKVYDYDGEAKAFYSADQDESSIILPASLAGAQITFGTVKGTYISSNYTVTTPGSHHIYFEITCPNYENYYGEAVIIINYKTRDGNLGYDADGKIYDAIAYSQDNPAVTNIHWLANPGEALPDSSQYTYLYYQATKKNDKYVIASQAYESVVDAGDYICQVTIPAGTLYAKTVLNIYFKISLRDLIVTINGEFGYAGGNIEYNVAEDILNYASVNGLVNDAPIIHTLSSGKIKTSGENVTEYKPKNIGAINYLILSDFNIKDQNHNLVTRNYNIILSDTSKITITKGDMTIINSNMDYNSVDGYYHIYNNDYVSPEVLVVVPAGVSQIEYSTDGINWQTEPYRFINVGSYTIYYRVRDVDNYYDVVPGGSHNSNCQIENPFIFEIKYAQNRFLEIKSMDKYYDGAAVNNPYIRMRDYTGYAEDGILTFEKLISSSPIVYSFISGNPIEAGQYRVTIAYPDSDNYTGVSTYVEFEIFKTPITLSFDELSLIYNTYEQIPNVSLSTLNYPQWDLNQVLTYGTDYTIEIYDQSDISFANPIMIPKNVGDYVIRYKLSADMAKNFTFDNGLDVINYNYSIKKRDVTVSFTGTKNYTGSVISIPVNEMDFANFPGTVQLASTSVIYTNDIIPQLYTCNNDYTTIQFTSVFHFGTDNPKIQFIATPTLFDDLSNYNIRCSISLLVSSNEFPYTVAKYDGVYDGEEHSFTFTPLATCENIEYSIDGGSTYSQTLPTFTNYTGGTVHIVVRVTSSVYAASEPNNYIIYGDNPSAYDYDEFTVNITKAERPISFMPGTDLNKIYDDVMIVNPTVQSIGTTGYSNHVIYRYVRIEGISEIEVSTLTSVYNIGDYKVYVYIAETTNYNQSITIELPFTITPRDITIKYNGQTKEFNAVRWSSMISNDSSVPHGGGTIVGVTNVTESGLVSGHFFKGVLQTYSANAGYYEIDPTDFLWQDGYQIYKADNTDVTANYNIIIDVQVTITKASFDMNYADVTVDWDGFLHRITVEFNTLPDVPGDPNALIEYSEDGITWLSGNPGYIDGSHTVYWRVSATNYNTFNWSNKVTIRPLTNDPRITYNNSVIYSADHAIIIDTILSGQDVNLDTRDPVIEYYKTDGTKVGQELYSLKNTATPIDAGNYYLVFTYPAQSPFEGFRSEQYTFTINKYSVAVEWTTDLDSPNRMVYTGSPVNPIAGATGIGSYVINLTKTLVIPADGEAIDMGTYKMSCSIANPTDDNNYILTNDILDFSIIEMTEIVPQPADGTDIGYSLYSIEFETPSLNPITGQRYTYGDTIAYIVANITYQDASTLTHTYHYAFEFNLNTGIIDAVYDINDYNINVGSYVEVWNGILNQILFKIEPPSTLDLDYDSANGNYINIKLKLLNNNYTWGSTGDNAQREVKLLFNQKEMLFENDEIILYAGSPLDSYNFTTENSVSTYETNGRTFTITWNNSKLTFNVFVALTNGTTAEGDDTLLIENSDYELIWENNDQITTNAKLTIQSLNTSNYSFSITKTFSIISPIPDYLELVRNYLDDTKNKESDPILKVGFVYYEFTDLETSVPTVTKTLLKNETRGEVVADEPNSGKVLKDIYLGNVHQQLILRKLYNQFVHSEGQTIRFVYTDETGNEQYWDETSTNENGVVFDTQYAYTGLKVCLYKNSDLNTPIDSITIIVTGDSNGDGYSNINDITPCISTIKEVASCKDFNPYINQIEYLALLINSETFKVTVNQLTSLVEWAKVASSSDESVRNAKDFNYDYIIE